ncbi:MAG: ARMT1-like domain-containing protein [Thermodesulfobacteriota bacterium]
MRTSPACLPCFTKQATYTAGLATDSAELQNEIMARAARIISSFNLELSPPENAVYLYRMIAEQTGNPDIFAGLKDISNQTVLKMLPDLENKVRQAADPLRTAAILTLAGNIIDYGSHHDFDLHQAVNECLNKDLAIDDLDELRGDLHQAGKILYLGDNCGELVFDSLLIKQFNQEVTLAVKEKPVINDALPADAEECGLGDLCRIISNGTDCPGTPLQSCNDEFKKIFSEADLIISKGQGNFETLSEISGPIYFFLMVKCEVVARHMAESANRPSDSIKTGELVLMKKHS